MNEAANRLGAYQVVRRFGAGGMAETFLALRHGPAGFEQRVFIKRILPAFSSDPEFVELFLSEARIAASLRHSRIVGVIDFGVWDDSYFIALELVDGCDLRDVLRRSPGCQLMPEQIALIASDVAEALDYAHRRKERIVHRDVSPSNVLVSYEGEIRLSDFGIATALSSTHHPVVGQEQDAVKGKIPYMSPEQARGHGVDERSDLFSLGVVLYEALAGRRPFEAGSQVDVLTKIFQGVFPPLKSLRPDAPDELVGICERLLQSNPEHRFQSAHDLLRALDPLVPGPTSRRALGTLALKAQPRERMSYTHLKSGRVAAGARTGARESVRGGLHPHIVSKMDMEPPIATVLEPRSEASPAPARRRTRPTSMVVPRPTQRVDSSPVARPEDVTRARHSVLDLPSPVSQESSAVSDSIGPAPRESQPSSPLPSSPLPSSPLPSSPLPSASSSRPSTMLPPSPNPPSSTLSPYPAPSPFRPSSALLNEHGWLVPAQRRWLPLLAAVAAVAVALVGWWWFSTPSTASPEPTRRARVPHKQGSTVKQSNPVASRKGRTTQSVAALTPADDHPPENDESAEELRQADQTFANQQTQPGHVSTPQVATKELGRRDLVAGKSALLVVEVTPNAQVWVDGRRLKHSSPLRIRVTPGTHTVGAGLRFIETTRHVKLRAGETKNIDIDLDIGRVETDRLKTPYPVSKSGSSAARSSSNRGGE